MSSRSIELERSVAVQSTVATISQKRCRVKLYFSPSRLAEMRGELMTRDSGYRYIARLKMPWVGIFRETY